jgi:hypothetical protein
MSQPPRTNEGVRPSMGLGLRSKTQANKSCVELQCISRPESPSRGLPRWNSYPPLLPHRVARTLQEPVRARGTSAALPSAERRLAATARQPTPPRLRVPPPRQHAHHDHLLAQEPPIIQERAEESDHRLPSLEMMENVCPSHGCLGEGEAVCEKHRRGL